MPAPPSDLALLRYQIISAYLVLDPPRGARGAVLRELADKTWTLPDGEAVQFAAETLRGWIRKFRRGGLAALEDAPRERPGVGVLDDAQKALLCRLKREVPSRSVDRIIEVAEEMALIEPGLLKRSTVHRVLKGRGLSARKRAEASTEDLDRFEAAHPNDLWQSDMLAGPRLPDPARPGKQRRAWLHAWLDDHSRLLLAGRWSFKSDLPTLEIAFREALRRCGVPRRVYFDNGGPYRSKHMASIVSVLSNQRPIFTPARRPQGHGKIEAFNRLCRAAFVDEVQASAIATLDELNTAFHAWRDLKYNRRPHGETLQTPWDRWRAGLDRIVHVDERALADAFLFRATRTADKAGVLKLHGVRYQVGPTLARKRLEVRYDPENLDTIEVWHEAHFQERARPLEVAPKRRPRAKPAAAVPDPGPPTDYLGHLVDQHQPVDDHDAIERALAEDRRAADLIVESFRDLVVPDVFDEEEIREFIGRYGPFDPTAFHDLLTDAVALGGPDQHIHTLLRGLRDVVLPQEDA